MTWQDVAIEVESDIFILGMFWILCQLICNLAMQKTTRDINNKTKRF